MSNYFYIFKGVTRLLIATVGYHSGILENPICYHTTLYGAGVALIERKVNKRYKELNFHTCFGAKY